MKNATYRIIHFTKPNRHVALAWNYDEAVLISTRDYETYTEAREALEREANALNVRLRWFDGEYTCKGDGEYLEPIR